MTESVVKIVPWRGHGGVRCDMKVCRGKAAFKITTPLNSIGIRLCLEHKVRLFGDEQERTAK
jgi:hypothetical protein